MSSETDGLAIRSVVNELMRLLAEKDYVAINKLTQGVRLTAEQIQDAVDSYGRTVVAMPEESVHLIDRIQIQQKSIQAWSIYVPLFTKEEGRSDLSMDLTLVRSSNDSILVELNDLRVL